MSETTLCEHNVNESYLSRVKRAEQTYSDIPVAALKRHAWAPSRTFF